MAVFRVNKTKDYSVLSNRHLMDKDLSYKSKGLLSLMLSLPEDWDYSVDGLEQFANDGTSSIRTAMKELEKYGYLKRTAIRGEKGKIIDWRYDIYEVSNRQKPVVEKPQVDFPQVDNPLVENRTQQNTKEQNTEKEENKKEEIFVLNYLNEKAGTKYRPVESNMRFIKARIADGYTAEDLKTVVDKKVKEWKGTAMQNYLRPETLFNATKFESYMNGLETKEEKKKPSNNDYMKHGYDAEKLKGALVNIDEWEEKGGC